MKLLRLARIAAGLVGAICAGVPYLFVYAAGLRWFTALHQDKPSSSEFFTLESFAVYGLIGFPVFMAAGAAMFIWLISIGRSRR